MKVVVLTAPWRDQTEQTRSAFVFLHCKHNNVWCFQTKMILFLCTLKLKSLTDLCISSYNCMFLQGYWRWKLFALQPLDAAKGLEVPSTLNLLTIKFNIHLKVKNGLCGLVFPKPFLWRTSSFPILIKYLSWAVYYVTNLSFWQYYQL